MSLKIAPFRNDTELLTELEIYNSVQTLISICFFVSLLKIQSNNKKIVEQTRRKQPPCLHLKGHFVVLAKKFNPQI